jgi:hypothetical protein
MGGSCGHCGRGLDRAGPPPLSQAIGRQLIIVDARTDDDNEAAFATFVRHGAGGLLGGSGAFLNSHQPIYRLTASQVKIGCLFDNC